MSSNFVRSTLVEPQRGLDIQLGRAVIESRKSDNNDVWDNPRSWKWGHYHGQGDSRLWVPKRSRNGQPNFGRQVINYSHPRAAKAWRMLLTVYAVSGLAGAVILADVLRAFGLV
jgi:hypothetical protein